MSQPISFDVQRLIGKIAARHRLLKPDDAAFAIVTMNRLVLEESLEVLHSRVLKDLARFSIPLLRKLRTERRQLSRRRFDSQRR